MSPLSAVDYWQVLGLEPGADAARLKRAFREQARRWHPDLNGNDPVAEERFKRQVASTLSERLHAPVPLQGGTIAQPLPCLVQHLHLSRT